MDEIKTSEELAKESQEKRKKKYLIGKTKVKLLTKNIAFRQFIYKILKICNSLPFSPNIKCPLDTNKLFYETGVQAVGKLILNEIMNADENFLTTIINEKRNGLYE